MLDIEKDSPVCSCWRRPRQPCTGCVRPAEFVLGQQSAHSHLPPLGTTQSHTLYLFACFILDKKHKPTKLQLEGLRTIENYLDEWVHITDELAANRTKTNKSRVY